MLEANVRLTQFHICVRFYDRGEKVCINQKGSLKKGGELRKTQVFETKKG